MEWETTISLILYFTMVGCLIFTLGLYVMYKMENSSSGAASEEINDGADNKPANPKIMAFSNRKNERRKIYTFTRAS